MRGLFFEKDVLDVGTGTGDILCRWSHLANSVCGIDLSHAMLEQAEKVIDKSRVKLYQADFMKDLSWLGVFDVVISNRGSLACVLSPEQLELALKNISAVISPGGKLVVEMYSYLAYKKYLNLKKSPLLLKVSEGLCLQIYVEIFFILIRDLMSLQSGRCNLQNVLFCFLFRK